MFRNTLFSIISFFFAPAVFAQDLIPYKTPLGRWGFKNLSGQIIVNARYLHKPGEFSDELAIVTDTARLQGVVNKKGEEIVAPSYAGISSFQNGHALVTLYKTDSLNGKLRYRKLHGVINRHGKVIVSPDYLSIAGDFTNGWFVVADSADNHKVYFSEKGERINPPAGMTLLPINLGPGKFLVKKDKHYGIVNKKFPLLLPAEYTLLAPAPGGLIIATQNQKTGILNSKLKWLVKPAYKNIGDFNNGYAIVEFDNKTCGAIDTKGRITTSTKYERLAWLSQTSLPVAVFQIPGDSHMGLLNLATGKEITPAVYEFIDAESRKDITLFWRNGKRGLMDISGRELFYNEYDDFVNGFLFDRAWVKKNGKYGFIDRSGKLVIPVEYDIVNGFSDGLARVKKNGKSGYTDVSGNVVIPAQYEDAESFDGGIARVKNDKGQWFYIDLSGKEIK